MNKNQNIDDSLRKKLDAYEAAPPSYVWDNIQSQLNVQQKRRRLAYAGWLSAAAVIVLAFIAGWYFNHKNQLSEPDLAQQQIVPESNLQPFSTDSDKNKQVAVDQFTQENDKLANKINPITTAKTPATETKDEVLNSPDYDRYVASRERTEYSLLQQIEAVVTSKQPKMVAFENKSTKSVNSALAADKMLIAANMQTINQQKKNQQGWIIGAHVAPGYAARSVSHTDNYARNMTNNSQSGGSNVGGGISVQYKTSKRLRFETGIYYAKDGQKDNNSFELFASNSDMYYGVDADASPSREVSAFSNVVTTGSDGIAMNSTAGVIQMKSTPQGTNIAANLENSSNVQVNTLYSDGEFAQVFEFIEVPLYLRYSLLDKKIGIELLGGISAGFVVGNNAYLDNSYGIQNIGSTTDISTLNISGTLGVGVNYMLGKHLSFALEPRINYYLNSINTNPEVNYRPYRIGVYTGVYYAF